MRSKPETMLVSAMALFAVTGVTAILFKDVRLGAHDPVVLDPATGSSARVGGTSVSGASWFQTVRQFCNPVDVEPRLRWQPAPESDDGTMHEAACYAVAGKIDLARASIERIPEGERYLAAGVVFNAGHPGADAGNDLAAGPLMELVVEYWPNHYMALYHAGTAAYERGDRPAAADYLRRFLAEYAIEDGWRSNASTMLADVGQ
jgi:hypothetical protein